MKRSQGMDKAVEGCQYVCPDQVRRSVTYFIVPYASVGTLSIIDQSGSQHSGTGQQGTHVNRIDNPGVVVRKLQLAVRRICFLADTVDQLGSSTGCLTQLSVWSRCASMH